MRNTAQTILAISPGTKLMGLATWRGGELKEWGVKTFKGSWTKSKMKDILFSLQGFMEAHQITTLAIKKPDTSRSSAGLDQLVSEITILAKGKNISVHGYTLSQMKRYYSRERKFTKAAMIKSIAQKNPELFFQYNKEQRNRNQYYTKMFEAIALAKYCSRNLQHKKYSKK